MLAPEKLPCYSIDLQPVMFQFIFIINPNKLHCIISSHGNIYFYNYMFKGLNLKRSDFYEFK